MTLSIAPSRLPLALLCLLLLLAGLPQAAPCADMELPAKIAPQNLESQAAFPTGVTTYFGGTTWDPVDGRWEALPDSVWTFDSGVGSPKEGWTTLDQAAEGADALFRRLGPGDFTGTPCVGSAVGLGGDYSLWVGLNQAEAEAQCWVAGRGYGNFWVVSMIKDFAYDGTANLLVEYDYVVETEDDFDKIIVLVDTSAAGDGTGEVELTSYTGSAGGTESLILTQGSTLPSSPGSLRLAFRLRADGSYSDEDSLFATDCGAFAVDDILVRNTEYGGSLNDLSTFETGDDGWAQEIPADYWENYSRLAAVNDLPGTMPAGPCNLADSVLVFFDPDTGGHDPNLLDWAISPPIDLAASGFTGDDVRRIEYTRAANQDFYWGIASMIGIQFYPDTCAATGAVGYSPLIIDGIVLTEDSCLVKISDVEGLIPPHAQEVRLGVGATNLCTIFAFMTCGAANSTPWFDNVRLLVADSTLVGIRDDLAPQPPILAAPNPFNNSVTIHLAPDLAGPGPVTLRIFDLQGRLVRELRAPDAAQPLTWDGRDAKGQATAPGVYFARAATARWSGVTRIIRLE